MKKYFFLILFILSFVDSSASSVNRYSSKHYMRINKHHSSTISKEQSKKYEDLRLEYFKKDQALSRKINRARKDMNHCVLNKENPKKYEKFKKNIEKLRSKRSALKKEFHSDYIKIFKN